MKSTTIAVGLRPVGHGLLRMGTGSAAASRPYRV